MLISVYARKISSSTCVRERSQSCETIRIFATAGRRVDLRHRRRSRNHRRLCELFARRDAVLQSGRQKKQEQNRGSGDRRVPEVRGVQGDPGRGHGRHNVGPVRPLALLKSATRHNLRGAEIIVASDRVGLLEAARVSSSAVVAVALLFALRYRLLPRPEVGVLRQRCRRCLRG